MNHNLVFIPSIHYHRWKIGFDEEGKTKRESNARIVRWSDGSMSLHLGSEIFDVYRQPLQVRPTDKVPEVIEPTINHFQLPNSEIHIVRFGSLLIVVIITSALTIIMTKESWFWL